MIEVFGKKEWQWLKTQSKSSIEEANICFQRAIISLLKYTVGHTLDNWNLKCYDTVSDMNVEYMTDLPAYSKAWRNKSPFYSFFFPHVLRLQQKDLLT